MGKYEYVKEGRLRGGVYVRAYVCKGVKDKRKRKEKADRLCGVKEAIVQAADSPGGMKKKGQKGIDGDNEKELTSK
jgi:hypothetical protein